MPMIAKVEPIGRVGVCALDVKARSKASRNILTRLQGNGELDVVIFGDKVILDEGKWPRTNNTLLVEVILCSRCGELASLVSFIFFMLMVLSANKSIRQDIILQTRSTAKLIIIL